MALKPESKLFSNAALAPRRQLSLIEKSVFLKNFGLPNSINLGVSSSPSHSKNSKQSKEVANLKRYKKESSKSELVARKRKRVRDSLGALRSPT